MAITNCNELRQYIMQKYHMSVDVAREIIRQGLMTDQEMLAWRISALPNGGGSMQPNFAINLPRDEKNTLADILKRNEAWELHEALGKNWRDISVKMRNSPVITIYRASIYPIIPGSYVSESRQYVIEHREYVNAPEYHIYSLTVPLSSIDWLGDPHEFIYTPTLWEWKKIAKERLDRFPLPLRNAIMNC